MNLEQPSRRPRKRKLPANLELYLARLGKGFPSRNPLRTCLGNAESILSMRKKLRGESQWFGELIPARLTKVT
jgi:hypothetical protein